MNEWLEDLEYADDVCLLAHRFTDIKGKLNYLENLLMQLDVSNVITSEMGYKKPAQKLAISKKHVFCALTRICFYVSVIPCYFLVFCLVPTF
jgi:hypothetical protein